MFFRAELELESDAFYELRRVNGIKPARLTQSTPEEIDKIGIFFLENRNTFYFLFHPSGELIGSILHINNYIQSLCISSGYRRQGYGEKLAKYCINAILKAGFARVELKILEGNSGAERLYKKLGFEEITYPS